MANASQSSDAGRAWLALASLVLIYAVCNSVLSLGRFVDGMHWVAIGSVVVQPMLLGMWAALGPHWLLFRLPYVLAAGCALMLYSSYFQWAASSEANARMEIDTLNAMASATMFALATFLATIVRLWSGWQIGRKAVVPVTSRPQFQFSTRHLIGLTAIISGILAFGTGVVFTLPKPHWLFGRGIATGITVVFAAISFGSCLPVMAVPWLVLLERLQITTAAVGAVFWAGSTTLVIVATELLLADEGEHPWPLVFMIQTGAVAVGIVSALVLRLGGYRLVKRVKQNTSGDDAALA